jgi:hypothetical protein
VGIALVLKMIPDAVLAKCREKAQAEMAQEKRTHWVAAGFIIAIWILLAALSVVLVLRTLRVERRD